MHPDIFSRSEYLPAERETELLVLGPDGLPTARLRRRKDRMVLVPNREPDATVNPKSRRLLGLGLHSFLVAGVQHCNGAKPSLGATVRLVREPENKHDPNAIALYSERGARPFAYVRATSAKRLAKLLDGGVDLSAVCTRAAGSVGVTPMVLVARSEVVEHLLRG